MIAPAGTTAYERAADGRKTPGSAPRFGIGSQLWGGGGNRRVEYAFDETRRYATFVKAPQGMCIPKIASGANAGYGCRTTVMIRQAKKQVVGLPMRYCAVRGDWLPRTDCDPVDDDNAPNAMILTDGAKIVLTPTYQPYAIYRPLHDATVVPIAVAASTHTHGKRSMPAISPSAMRDRAGVIPVRLADLNPDRTMPVSTVLAGVSAGDVTGRGLTTATMDATNGYGVAPAAPPVRFDGAMLLGGSLSTTLPAKSLAVPDLR